MVSEEGSTLSFAAAILLHPVGSHVLETLLEVRVQPDRIVPQSRGRPY